MAALPELALNAVEEGTERASPLFAFEALQEAGELSQVCLAEMDCLIFMNLSNVATKKNVLLSKFP